MNRVAMRIAICVVLLGCSSQPTQEQLDAQADAQRRQIAAQALQAQLEKVRVDEQAGDSAALQGNKQEALAYYMAAVADAPDGTDAERNAREKVIRFVSASNSLPEVPEEAKRHAAHASVYFKAADYKSAVSEMNQACKLAPWWADGYYNLGLMQEGAKQYGEAITSLNLFLVAAPRSPEAAAVRSRIYELEVKKEQEDKTRALAGDWFSTDDHTHLVAVVKGDKLELQADQRIFNGGNGWTGGRDGAHFSLVKRGTTLEGTKSIPATNWSNPWVGGLLGPTINVVEPAQLVPCSGKIADDGSSIELRCVQTQYQIRADIGASAAGKQEVVTMLKR